MSSIVRPRIPAAPGRPAAPVAAPPRTSAVPPTRAAAPAPRAAAKVEDGLRVDHSTRLIKPATITLQENGRDFIIGPVRLAYPNIARPKQDDAGDKYQCCIIIPPGSDVDLMINTAEEVILEKLGKGKRLTPTMKRGIRNAEDYAGKMGFDDGWFFMNPMSRDQPVTVDRDRNPCDPTLFYPGCWVRLRTRPFFFSNTGNQGAGWGLNALQFLYNDTRLDNRVSAATAFDDWQDDGQDDEAPF